MANISKINEQLKLLSEEIERHMSDPEHLERLCRAQECLVKTQLHIWVELVEAEVDIPTLPLFIEERESDDSNGTLLLLDGSSDNTENIGD